MKILIPGIDGYIGWPLAMSLASDGHKVFGIDNFARRENVKEVGSWSAIPIRPLKNRIKHFEKIGGKIRSYEGDLQNGPFVQKIVAQVQPDCIVHLGEQPSAPYSMIDLRHASYTQVNNVLGTMNILWAMKDWAPDCHLLKLGTMGEYGTPNIDIPEGKFKVEFRGREAHLPFPKQPGSLYHLSKAFDSMNIEFLCRMWGLRSTDIMQGVVYGLNTPEMLKPDLWTRFDFDAVFGTAINRFVAQAVVGLPITPYGKGGQMRGYLALKDSIQCLKLALENPPDEEEYRVFNQFDAAYKVQKLAAIVAEVAIEYGLEPEIQHIDNPRIEEEEHYYNPDHDELPKLGFKPDVTIWEELREMFPMLTLYKDRIIAKQSALHPKVNWRRTR